MLKLVTLPNVLLNTHIRPDQQPAEEDEDENDSEERPMKGNSFREESEGEGDEDDEEDEEDDEIPEADPADGDFKGVELDIPDSEEERKVLLQKVGLQSRFFMGDWAGLVDLLDFKSNDDKYDLILTSETIYAEESHTKLYTTIKNSLKQGGKA